MRARGRRVLIPLVLTLAAAVALSACSGPRVGVVESRRILNESVLALRYQRELDAREKAMAADLRLLTGRMSQEDLEARRRSYLTELGRLKQSLENQLNERIRDEVAVVARERRMRVVLVKEAAEVGGIDITNDVIERLK